jgi:hypothetical protein
MLKNDIPAVAPAAKTPLNFGGGYRFSLSWPPVHTGNIAIYDVYKTIPTVILARNGGRTLVPMNDHPWCLTDDARTNGVKDL